MTAVSVDKIKSGKRGKRSNRMKSTCIAEEDVVSRAERTGIQTREVEIRTEEIETELCINKSTTVLNNNTFY